MNGTKRVQIVAFFILERKIWLQRGQQDGIRGMLLALEQLMLELRRSLMLKS